MHICMYMLLAYANVEAAGHSGFIQAPSAHSHLPINSTICNGTNSRDGECFRNDLGIQRSHIYKVPLSYDTYLAASLASERVSLLTIIRTRRENSADDKLIIFFLLLSRKKGLTFHANCLLLRRHFA